MNHKTDLEILEQHNTHNSYRDTIDRSSISQKINYTSATKPQNVHFQTKLDQASQQLNLKFILSNYLKLAADLASTLTDVTHLSLQFDKGHLLSMLPKEIELWKNDFFEEIQSQRNRLSQLMLNLRYVITSVNPPNQLV